MIIQILSFDLLNHIINIQSIIICSQQTDSYQNTTEMSLT